MQKLQLSIPEPCHENWHAMTPTEQGRYCNACAKEVIDFSMMTDTEVLNYFSSFSQEKVCGRAMPSQLDRVISRPVEPKKRLFWYWNYIVMLFLFFTKTQGAKAQIKPIQETEQTPVKSAEANKGDIVITQWQVKGKIIDSKNNPVPFASISIKGKRFGTAADAEGNFMIKAGGGDILIAAAVGYQVVEMPVGMKHYMNFVLEENSQTLGGFMITKKEPTTTTNSTLIKVKEDGSGTLISNARIIVAMAKTVKQDSGVTDHKGLYRLSDIKKNETYFIRVEAEGYGSNEFSATAKELKSKREWDVLLTKKKQTIVVRSQAAVTLGAVNAVRLRCESGLDENQSVLYVVDGVIVPDVDKIDIDDIEDITVLEGPSATALFGYAALHGAIVITTRKSKVKNLDTVALKTDINYVRGRLGGMYMSYMYISRYAEAKARINTILSDSLKIFPNPVQRGSSFNVALKVKQLGEYSIQLADATGRIILQRRINVVAKQQTEQIAADSRWAAGIYYIRIFNNKNELISKNSFVVR